MSERKVLSKYYPADFDPSAIARPRGNKNKQAGPKVQTVRLMAPFAMRCSSCGEYIYKGRKFNARKETPEGERYLGIQIFRFYIRCTRCSAEIVFRTDPKNQDYLVERGAKKNTEPWKRGLGEREEETDEQKLDRLEREMAEAEGEDVNAGERNAMMELEAKTEEARREMAVADALDEIRSRNARMEKAKRDGVEVEVVVPEDEERLRQEKEDEEAAKRAFAFARKHAELEEELMDVDGTESETSATTSATSGAAASSAASSAVPAVAKPVSEPSTDMPPPSFKRQVKKKKDHAALLGIKKKTSLV